MSRKNSRDASPSNPRERSDSKDEYPRAPRVYLANGYRRRAGTVVYRIGADDTVRVLMITSRKTDGKWILPAGSVDPGEDEAIAAVRETEEEAGITGVVTQELIMIENPEKKTYTMFFALRAADEYLPVWEESERSREWVPAKEARERLTWREYEVPVLDRFLKLSLAQLKRVPQPSEPKDRSATPE